MSTDISYISGLTSGARARVKLAQIVAVNVTMVMFACTCKREFSIPGTRSASATDGFGDDKGPSSCAHHA